jgi:hypothetical protein
MRYGNPSGLIVNIVPSAGSTLQPNQDAPEPHSLVLVALGLAALRPFRRKPA